MEAGSGPATHGQGSNRGLLWGLIITVVVLAAAGIAALVILWPGEEPVTVPDLVGLEERDAERVVADLGLELAKVERVGFDAATAEPNTVLSQLPLPGTEVDSGSQVALVVAEEPQEETSEEDRAETPPTESDGSGGRTDTGTDAGAATGTDTGTKTPAKPEPKETWHSVGYLSGQGDYQSPPFTTSSGQLDLTVKVSSPGGGQFRFILVDPNGGSGTALDVTVSGTPTSETHAFEAVSVPPGTYHVRIKAPANGDWWFKLREWR